MTHSESISMRDDGIALAHHLGRALQLTNILRDIDEDAAIGRVYLPREAMLTAGVDLDTPAAITTHPAIPEVCTNLATQAQTHFQAAEAIMYRSPRQWVRASRNCGLPCDPDETLGTRPGEATLSGESPHFAANRHPVALGIHLVDKQIHGIDAGLAAPHTGGIHRSNFDRTLNAKIDNGNHLVSFGNLGTLVCVHSLGVRNQSTGPDQLNFPFFELGSGGRWSIYPSKGKSLAWIFGARRSPSDMHPTNFVSLLRFLGTRPHPTFRILNSWTEPLGKQLARHLLSLLVISTEPPKGSAWLTCNIKPGISIIGDSTCRSLAANHGFGAAFVNLALCYLGQRGRGPPWLSAAQHRIRRRLSY